MNPEFPVLPQAVQLLATTFAGTLTFFAVANAARILLKEREQHFGWALEDLLEELPHLTAFLAVVLVICGLDILLTFGCMWYAVSPDPSFRRMAVGGKPIVVAVAGAVWFALTFVTVVGLARYLVALRRLPRVVND